MNMGKKSREKRWRKSLSINNPPAENQRTVTTAVRQEFSGPIPPPALLQQYDLVVSGAAERILKMAENQAAHRMELEKLVIQSDVRKSEKGQRFGFCVAIGGLVAAFVLGMAGHEVAAGIIGGGDLVSLAGVFVINRKKKEKERERAREELGG